ncbi:transcriptional regulator [Apiospora saccharicola]|uniref:Transcriptional regulator n=1 Tax=Apiospora saccharicola TaxID=335842 RepID=A0ABR1U1M4_9PEZI
MTKPVCSNCQLYKVRCTTTLIRRRAPMAPKPKTADVPPPPSQEPRLHNTPNANESLEARLKGIEARLDSLGASSGGGDASLASLLGYPPPIINPGPLDFSSNVDLSMLETEGSSSEPVVVGNSSSSGSSSSHASSGVDGVFPELPPLHEALPVIERYFQDFNSALPLHHEPTFMKLLHRCYSGGVEQHQQRQKVEFALVHSVLAIGYRLRPSGADGNSAAMPPNPFAGDKSQQCLQSCGRLLQDLVTWDEDALGIQVLLAIVVLHLADGDDKLASMLVSAAMRLAHSLQMHTEASDVAFPLHEAQQRHNIFWICYCLDKDISLRTITPSVQLDCDIDLGLPGIISSCVSPENMFGIMEDESWHGQESPTPPPVHYLRARVQLAFIEGQIYDQLYSVRSLKQTPEQRRQQVARLDALLDTWRRSSLPPAVLAHHHHHHQEGQIAAAENYSNNDPGLAATLNHTYLFCLFTLHGLYSLDSVWVQNIDILGRTALENFSNKSERCMHSLQPPIPDAWNKCVLASRRSVQLINNSSGSRRGRSTTTTTNTNCDIWSSTCLLFSALVILLVNITYEPGHERAPQDRQLAAEGAVLFKRLLHHKKGDGDTSSKNTLASVLRGLELAADKWTGYYELDPLSVRPPLPAKGYDLFGNGILTMPASSMSTSDFLREDETEPISFFDDSMGLWTERTSSDGTGNIWA